MMNQCIFKNVTAFVGVGFFLALESWGKGCSIHSFEIIFWIKKGWNSVVDFPLLASLL